MGCMLSAASCNKWWMDEIIKTKEYSEEQKPITDDMLGNNRVFFLPYLMGERSPHNNPAARAGAAYVSPFLGRLDDISQPGIDLIRDIVDIFANYDISTEIICASVRNPIHITDCALAGADIATVPYKVIEQMVHHPLTDAGIDKFKKDYEAVFGK